jgi:hypothetical protein
MGKNRVKRGNSPRGCHVVAKIMLITFSHTYRIDYLYFHFSILNSKNDYYLDIPADLLNNNPHQYYP